MVASLGQSGNMSRNVLRGSTQKRFDLAIAKKTNITERTSFEIRSEIFNLFNNVNFALPINDLADSSVGNIESKARSAARAWFSLGSSSFSSTSPLTSKHVVNGPAPQGAGPSFREVEFRTCATCRAAGTTRS
jgi:hypothetical protein